MKRRRHRVFIERFYTFPAQLFHNEKVVLLKNTRTTFRLEKKTIRLRKIVQSTTFASGHSNKINLYLKGKTQ